MQEKLKEINLLSNIDDLIINTKVTLRYKDINSLLMTAYTLNLLKIKCTNLGLDYFGIALDELNLAKTTASKLARIGCEFLYLESKKDHIPASYNSLYELITLPKPVLESIFDSGVITQQITYDEIRLLKTAYKEDSLNNFKIKLTLHKALKILKIDDYINLMFNKALQSHHKKEEVEQAKVVLETFLKRGK